MSAILSIQSAVAYGHVGNSAAVFPLQRLGFEVWPVNTVQFSNHSGYGSWRGEVFSSQAVGGVIEGIAERGVLPRCGAVLSGYLGDVALGQIVLGAVARVKAANPKAVWCCDPVIGDTLCFSPPLMTPEETLQRIPEIVRESIIAATA